MSDPVGERLRSYYQSIQGDMPARLEARVARSLDATETAGAAGGARAPWRPAFGLLGAGAAVIIIALVVRGLGTGPGPTPSGVTGPSGSPSATSSAEASGSLVPNPSAGCSVIPAGTAGCGEPTQTSSPSPTPTPTGGPFRSVGPMNPVTNGPSVTLNDGRVLIAGGMALRSDGFRFKSNAAQLYNPATGRFTPTGSMADARAFHTATLLKDGRVLVVGGADLSDGIDNLTTAEIYDPATGIFTRTGSLAHGRAEHTATLLSDGRVLVTGGFGGGTLPVATAEVYDPATGTFSATGSMSVPRMYHTATLLPNGRVLIAGGIDDFSNVLASAELYDRASGAFTATGSMAVARQWHTATPLGGGRVLIAGGASAGSAPLNSAEIYDATTGHFTATGSMVAAHRSQTATLLTDGTVLIAGGDGITSAEIYWPSTGVFGSRMAMLGLISSAALLHNGQVLLTGDTAQIYTRNWI